MRYSIFMFGFVQFWMVDDIGVKAHAISHFSQYHDPPRAEAKSNRRLFFLDWFSFIASYFFQPNATNSENGLG